MFPKFKTTQEAINVQLGKHIFITYVYVIF